MYDSDISISSHVGTFLYCINCTVEVFCVQKDRLCMIFLYLFIVVDICAIYSFQVSLVFACMGLQNFFFFCVQKGRLGLGLADIFIFLSLSSSMCTDAALFTCMYVGKFWHCKN